MKEFLLHGNSNSNTTPYTVHLFTYSCLWHITAYGLGYGWDPLEAVARVGDIIRWKWASPPFITAGARFGVWQISPGGDQSYDGTGFISPIPGSFTGKLLHLLFE